MKLITMEVQNVLSYRHAVIDLSDLTYCSVTGPNGMGKSALFQAMRWILFGPKALRVASAHDSVVHDDAKVAVGRLIVESQGHRWLIVRERTSRKAGTVRLAVEVDGQWRSYGDKLNAVAEQQIRQIVGVSMDVFNSVAYIDQSGEAAGSRLISASSADRREILQSLLPELAVWNDIEAAISQRLSEVRGRLERLGRLTESAEETVQKVRDRLAALDGQGSEDEDPEQDPVQADGFEEQDEDDLRLEASRIASAIETTSAALGELGGARAALLAERDAAEARAERNEANLERERRDLLSERRGLEAAQLAVAEYHARRELVQQDLLPTALEEVSIQQEAAEERERAQASRDAQRKRLESRRTDLASSLRRAQDALSDLHERQEGLRSQHRDDGECWICQAKLEPQRYDDLLASLHDQIQVEQDTKREQKEKLDNVTDKLDDLNREDSAARREDSAGARAAERAAREVEDLQTELRLSAPATPARSVDEVEELLEEVQAEIESSQQKWDAASVDFEQRLEALQDDGARRSLGQEISDLRARRDQVERLLEQIAQESALRAELEEQFSQARRTLGGLRSQSAPLLAQAKRLEFLQGAAGSRGVPMMLMDSFLASLEDHQNRLLASLSGVGAAGMPTSVEYRTTRELRSKEGKRDVLDIMVSTRSGTTRPIESFSFGERARLMIAQAFALVAVLNERHPGLITTLILDEPMTPLDDQGIAAFIELLRTSRASAVVENIYVMTHDPRVIEALPQRLTITHTIEEGSSIHVHR